MLCLFTKPSIHLVRVIASPQRHVGDFGFGVLAAQKIQPLFEPASS